MTVSYLSPNGRFMARVEGPRSGNVLLRRAQGMLELARGRDAPLRLRVPVEQQ